MGGGAGGTDPVVRELPGWRSPLDVLPLFARDRAPALLLSAGPEGTPRDIARFSFLSADPYDLVRWDAWREDGRPSEGDPFERLECALSPHACAAGGPWPFAGGAIGWLGYDARLAVEPVLRPTAKRAPPGEVSPPDVLFGLYGWTIAWDHARRTWAVVAGGAPERGRAGDALARERAESIARRVMGQVALEACSPAGAGPGATAGAARTERRALARVLGTSLPRADYLKAVEAAGDLITGGEVYQVNLAQRLEITRPADPAAAFAAAASRSPAPFMAYLDLVGTQVVCASPERFVRLQGRRAETRPIKGTRPRGRTPEEDVALREALASSAKDRAENVMIVDLERNDLGRVCAPGSVRVDRLCGLESYASVHHLVSVVSGDLASGRSRADLLRAMFPGGSMTGAPKVRAMRAIDDLEPVTRGVYSGSIGYLSFSGAMDLNIVIRSLVISGNRAWLHAGGGIVADSVPADEFTESLDKARSMREALGALGSGKGRRLREPKSGPRGWSRGSGRASRRWAR